MSLDGAAPRPSPQHLSLAARQAHTSIVDDEETSEVLRMHGAPRTRLAPLVGDCSSLGGAGGSSSAGGVGGDSSINGEGGDGGDCGLRWWAVYLVEFGQFFEDGDRDRDFSLQLFLLWLLLQLYVLHTTMRTAFQLATAQIEACKKTTTQGILCAQEQTNGVPYRAVPLDNTV